MTETLVKTQHNWSDSQKREFIEDYFETGVMKVSALKLGIPYETVKHWSKADWFVGGLSELREAKTAAMKARFLKVQEKALDVAEDILDNGEERITNKGDIVRVTAPLASVNMLFGTVFDKKALMERQAPSSASAEDTLQRIADLLNSKGSAPETIDVEMVEIVETHSPAGGEFSEHLSQE